MKTNKIKLLLLVILVLCYITLDRSLFFYGESDFNFYKALPLSVKPDSRPDFENGFALKDKFGITIAAKGNTYDFHEIEIEIQEVFKYYYDIEKIYALINDVQGKAYYVLFTQKRQSEIRAEVVDDLSDEELKNYRCIELRDNKNIKRFMLVRNYILYILIGLFSYITFHFVKSKMK